MLKRGLRFNGDIYVLINCGVDVFSCFDNQGVVGRKQRYIVNRLGYGLGERALRSYLRVSEFGDVSGLDDYFSVIASGDEWKVDRIIKELKLRDSYRFDGIGFRIERESISDFLLWDEVENGVRIRLGLLSQTEFEKYSREVGFER